MRLFNASQMRAADRAAAEAGIPTGLLMEAAGRAVADAGRHHWPEAKRFLILCGRGNNGGDGYVAARYLAMAGRAVTLLELPPPADTGASDARVARAAWIGYRGGDAVRPLEAPRLRGALATSDVIVDALLGSGLSRPLVGGLAALVDTVNDSGLPVLAVDVPTGIDADAAIPPGPHVRATRTVQLAGAKLASALHPARAAFGAWEVADIGIPAAILDAHGAALYLDRAAVAPALPRREPDAHKYGAGTVLVVAGSPRYLGAAELACRSAYRAGAGLVTLAAEARLAGSWPEIVFTPLDWAGAPLAALAALGDRHAGTRVIGPGLDSRAQGALPELIAQSGAPTLLDAGALVADEAVRRAVRRHGGCTLTPHHGEAGRLLSTDGAAVRADPLGAARELAEQWRATVALKGAGTVVAAPDGRLALSAAGHPGMASGGTGDVLAGLLGAWLWRSDEAGGPFERVGAGVFVHGLAGERAARRFGLALTAGDLVEALPAAWLECAG